MVRVECPECKSTNTLLIEDEDIGIKLYCFNCFNTFKGELDEDDYIIQTEKTN